MGDRQLENGNNYEKGVVYADCSFLANNTSSPVSTSFRGASAIASITRAGVGIFTVTLKDRYRYVTSKSVDLEDLNSSDDGAYASIGAVQNEGSASTAPSFNIYTRAAAGTKTDYTARRVSFQLVLKNSSVGT